MFHGGCRQTPPAGGQKGVSPRRNAYTALLRSCSRSCMIWVSRCFLWAYTSSPTEPCPPQRAWPLQGPRTTPPTLPRTAASGPRVDTHHQGFRPPCSLHAMNSSALSVREGSAVNSSIGLHRSPATSSSPAHSKCMWPTFSSGPPQKIQGWAGIATRVSFCLHRRTTCIVDERPSHACSIFLCVGPWCTAPRGHGLTGASQRRMGPGARRHRAPLHLPDKLKGLHGG